MPIVRLASDTCLISQFVQYCGKLDAAMLTRTCIVLPTKRLEPYLLAQLGSERHPTITTFENFLRSQCRSADEIATAELSGLTGEIILAGLLRQGDYPPLAPGHEHEIHQLFQEIATHLPEGGEIAFGALAEMLRNDFYRADQHIASLNERISSLQRLYQDYQPVLAAKGFVPVQTQLALYADQLLKRWSNAELPWERLYFAGFTTLNPGMLPLMRMLVAKTNVGFWCSASPQLLSSVRPLADLVSQIQTIDVQNPEAQKSERKPVRVIAAESVLGECRAALACAKEAIASGVHPARIAILVSSERAYSNAISELIGHSGLTANLAVGRPITAAPFGRWLALWVDYVLALGDRTKEVCALLQHPMTQDWLVTQGCTERPSAHLLSEYRRNPGCKDETVAACEGILRAAYAPVLSGTASMNDWGATLTALLAVLVPDDAPQNSIDRSAHEAVDHLIAALQASEFPGQRSTAREFLQLFKNKLGSLEVRSTGYPHRGIQVLSLTEARYVPFTVAIVLGCIEGLFPRSLPSDHLLSNGLKVRMGLPGWEYVEALEETSFRLLLERIPQLILLYPQLAQSGEETVPSRFIELLHAEGVVIETHASFPDRSLPAGQRSEVQGGVACPAALLKHQSATSLTHLLACPYRFLLHQLGVREQRPATQDDAVREGRWLHKILEAFFTGKIGAEAHLPPLTPALFRNVNQRSNGAEAGVSPLTGWAEARLSQLTTIVLPPALHRSPLAVHLRTFAWPRFAAHWAGILATQPSWLWLVKERTFGKSDHDLVVMNLGEGMGSIVLQGSIDSVDGYPDFFVLTDYKRRSAPAPLAVARGDEPQLAVYALALAQMSVGPQTAQATQGIAGYWSILEGVWHPRGVGAEVRPIAQTLGLCRDRTPDLTHLIETVRTRVQARVAPLLRGAPFAPEAQAACTYCGYAGICRRRDPRYAKGFETKVVS